MKYPCQFTKPVVVDSSTPLHASKSAVVQRSSISEASQVRLEKSSPTFNTSPTFSTFIYSKWRLGRICNEDNCMLPMYHVSLSLYQMQRSRAIDMQWQLAYLVNILSNHTV